MATNVREVCLEIYVDGEFHCRESCWIPEDGDVDLEFNLSDDICDLMGHPLITVELEHEADDPMTVNRCSILGNVVKLAVKNDATYVCPCDRCAARRVETGVEGPEDRPTDSTKAKKKNKICSFLKKLFLEDLVIPEEPSDPEKSTEVKKKKKKKDKICSFLKKLFLEDLVIPEEPSVPEPEPELDLVDADGSSVPGPSSSEPLVQDLDDEDSGVDQDGIDSSSESPEENVPRKSTKVKKKKNKICSFLKKLFLEDLVITEEPSVPKPEPELDLVDADGSSVPGPSSSEPLVQDLDDDSSGVDQDGTDSSSESPEENIPKKSTKTWRDAIGGVFKGDFCMDPAIPEPVCVADASSSEPTSDLDLGDTEKSSDSETESELDLVDADVSSVPGPSNSEPLVQDLDDDGSGVDQDGIDGSKVKKKKKNKICSFLKKLFLEDLVIPEEPSDPEPEPELDLVDADGSSVPGPSNSEPLVQDLDDDGSGVDQDGIDGSKVKKKKKNKICSFLKKLFLEDLVIPEEPSDPEPEPELDLVDADRSSVPGPSNSEPLVQDLDGDNSGVDQDGIDGSKVKKKKKNKICSFLKKLFLEDLVIPEEPSDPEPEPELDLVDADGSSVPGPSSSEPLVQDLDDDSSGVDQDGIDGSKVKKKKKNKICSFFKKLFLEDLVIPEEPSDPEPEPELDLVDADGSSVPGPSSSEPLVQDLDDDGSGIDQDGIDGSKVRKKKKNKICSFLKKLFLEDLVIPEEPSDPEPEPELDLVDADGSSVPGPSSSEPLVQDLDGNGSEVDQDGIDGSKVKKKKNKICSFLKKLFLEDLVIPEEPSVPEPEPELDLVDADGSSVPGPSSSEPLVQDLDGNGSEVDQDGIDGSKVKKKNKICSFLKKLFLEDLVIPEEQSDPEPSVPEPEPELDLVDPQEPTVPEPEPELDLVDPQEPTVPEPEPELDLVDPQEPTVPEPEPELDLVDPQEPSVPSPSSSEPLVQDLDDDDAILDMKSPTLVSGDLMILNGSGVDQDGIDSSSESPEENIPKKSTKTWRDAIGGVFKGHFCMDPAVPEPVCFADASSSEPTSDLDLGDTEKSSVSETESELYLADAEDSSDSDPEPELDLVDAEESSVPGPSSSEPVVQDLDGDSSGIDQDGIDASSESPEENIPKKSTEVKKKKKNKICSFLKKLFLEDLVITEEPSDPDPSDPEPEPELDLLDPQEPSVPEPEPELDLADTDKSSIPCTSFFRPGLHLVDSCTLVPRFHEPEPYCYLDDSDESCDPGPSSYVPKPFKQDLFQEQFHLEERLKGCTIGYKDVTEVWTNIFIGNEEIARDRMRLKELGITHILNAAAMKKKLRILLGMPWKKDLRDTVDTGASYYRGMKIRYCGLPTRRGSNISKYFLPAAEFIHMARKNSENKVFIHCTDGVSNAPTLFLAYLMIHQNKTVENAIDYLIKVRYIKPEIEFLRQLAILNVELGMKFQ